MAIDWNHFTPWTSLTGGIVLGIAASLFILLNGRVLGISGILGGLSGRRAGDVGWRICFLLGLLAAPLLVWQFGLGGETRIDADWSTLLVAGLLVGIGTRLGSGCTSGHGVCGLSQRSPRSLVATLAFMAAGIVTVYLVRHAFV